MIENDDKEYNEAIERRILWLKDQLAKLMNVEDTALEDMRKV